MVVPVKIPSTLRLTDEQFERLVAANSELRLELNAAGSLVVMHPTGSEGGRRNLEISTDLAIWNRQTQAGVVFDSSSGFRLPNGAIRSPDCAWVSRERWQSLTLEEQRGFAPICPDFFLELVSETDNLAELRLKMQEYLDNGCRLGWLIDPKTQTVELYRPRQPVEILQTSVMLSGETVLPGLVLSLERVF